MIRLQLWKVEDTVTIIKKLIRDCSYDSSIRQTVEEILYSVPEKEQYLEIKALYEWLCRHYRYTKDVYGEEYIKAPLRMMSEIRGTGFFCGDCDDAVVLSGCFLKTAGYPVILSILKKPTSNFFSHIFCYTYTLNGVHIPFDLVVDSFGDKVQNYKEERLFDL
jgi:hypothetical protein